MSKNQVFETQYYGAKSFFENYELSMWVVRSSSTLWLFCGKHLTYENGNWGYNV